MTLPSKYSHRSNVRHINIKLILILGGIVGGIILLAAVSPKYIPTDNVTGEPIEYKIEGILTLFLFLFSVLGVLLLIWHKLGLKVPEWRKKPPTRNETLFAMGIAFLVLGILTFYSPMNALDGLVGDVLIYVSSTMGLSQYFICLIIALFFFGFVIYLELRSKHYGKLLILSIALMLGIFSLIFSLIILHGTGPNSIFLNKDQFTVTELIEMGNILLSSDNYKEAISYYDRALNLEPNNPDALYQKRVALHYLDHQSFHKWE